MVGPEDLQAHNLKLLKLASGRSQQGGHCSVWIGKLSKLLSFLSRRGGFRKSAKQMHKQETAPNTPFSVADLLLIINQLQYLPQEPYKKGSTKASFQTATVPLGWNGLKT